MEGKKINPLLRKIIYLYVCTQTLHSNFLFFCNVVMCICGWFQRFRDMYSCFPIFSSTRLRKNPSKSQEGNWSYLRRVHILFTPIFGRNWCVYVWRRTLFCTSNFFFFSHIHTRFTLFIKPISLRWKTAEHFFSFFSCRFHFFRFAPFNSPIFRFKSLFTLSKVMPFLTCYCGKLLNLVALRTQWCN